MTDTVMKSGSCHNCQLSVDESKILQNVTMAFDHRKASLRVEKTTLEHKISLVLNARHSCTFN